MWLTLNARCGYFYAYDVLNIFCCRFNRVSISKASKLTIENSTKQIILTHGVTYFALQQSKKKTISIQAKYAVSVAEEISFVLSHKCTYPFLCFEQRNALNAKRSSVQVSK